MQAALSPKDGRHTLPFSSLSAFRDLSLKKHLPRCHIEGFCEITHSLTHYSLLSPSLDSGTPPRDHLPELSCLLKCWPDCPLDCELLGRSLLTPRTDTVDGTRHALHECLMTQSVFWTQSPGRHWVKHSLTNITNYMLSPSIFYSVGVGRRVLNRGWFNNWEIHKINKDFSHVLNRVWKKPTDTSETFT